MRTRMTVIDGTKNGGKAPLPNKGLTKAVCECVDALGEATASEVRRMLPAAITDGSQIVSMRKLEKTLYNAKYRGYLIHNPKTDTYKRAPMAYYEARVEQCTRQQRESYARRLLGKARRKPQPVMQPRPFWHWAVLAATFIAGALAGSLTCQFLV